MPNHPLAIDQGIKHDNKKIYQQVKAFIHENRCITHPLLQKIIEILRTWQQAPLHHWLIELTYNQRLYLAQNKREPYNSVDIIIEYQNYLILFNQHSSAYRSLDKLRWYRVYANRYAYTLVYYQYHQESEQFIRFA